MSQVAELKGINNVRKAAIMMVIMGPEVAGKLVQHMNPRQVARLAREVAEIGPVDPDLSEKILHEYYQDALRPPVDRGGPELARTLLSTASIPEDQVERLLGPQSDSVEDILGTLLEAPAQSLAKALENEHPQTTALVLLHIPAKRASTILGFLPEEIRSEAILRMATLRQVSGEVVGDVAASLQDRLAAAAETGGGTEEDGLQKTAEVLSRLARNESRRLLEELEGEHPEQVEQLKDLVFTFESLIDADDAGLQELLRQVDSGKVALALHGSDETLTERFLANLSERAGSMLKEEIEYLGSVNSNDQQASRKEIVEIALKLEAEGKLQFAEPGDEES